MVNPVKFGEFLLFKKGEERPYASSYRAGTVHGRIIDRVVRLELFDGKTMDRQLFLRHLPAAGAIQPMLEDPHIARGIGVGMADGIPYAAYDFELGVSLTDFLDTARRRRFPIPLDQALFVTERISLALSAALDRKHEGRPVTHGFLVPDSVLLAHDGSVKVFGFEIGKALREQFGATQPLDRYIAIEARGGGEGAPNDDVFSLGVLLYELLAGAPLGEANFARLPEIVDQLVVQATNEPAPESIRALLKKSLAPRAERFEDALAWQQSLGRIILEGEFNPTTFNLAFLMHTLFREQLEQAREELKEHKSYRLPEARDVTGDAEPPTEPTAPATVAPAPIPAAEPAPTGPVPVAEAGSGTSAPALGDAATPTSEVAVYDEAADETTGVPLAGDQRDRDEPAPLYSDSSVADSSVSGSSVAATGQASGRRKLPFWLGFAATAAIATPLVYFMAIRGGEAGEGGGETLAPRSAQSIGTGAEGPSALGIEPTQMASETVVADSRLASAGGDELGEDAGDALGKLPPPPDQDAEALDLTKKELQALLAERAQAVEANLKAEFERRIAELQNKIEAQDQAAESGTGSTAAVQTAARSASTPAPTGGAQAPSGTVSQTLPKTVVSPSSTQAARPSTPTAAESAIPAGGQAGAGGAEPIGSKEAVPAPKAAVRTPPKLLRLSQPVYPAAARRLNRSASVRVKVLVAPDGKVREATILGAKAGSGFDNAALTAVRKSKWKPGTVDGRPTEAWTMVTIEFVP